MWKLADRTQRYNSSDKNNKKRRETYSANRRPCGNILRVDRWLTTGKTGGQPRRVGDGLGRPDLITCAAFHLINKNKKETGLQGEQWSCREEGSFLPVKDLHNLTSDRKFQLIVSSNPRPPVGVMYDT